MSVNRSMEQRLAYWLGRFSTNLAGFLCWRNDTTEGYCAAVVWRQIGPSEMQAIELYVAADLQVWCCLHPIEPLRPVGSLLT